MCGIVGFTGARAAAPVLLGGLERLEYRGYDSAVLAYYAAKEKGCDIDKPKNLAKSVTVE